MRNSQNRQVSYFSIEFVKCVLHQAIAISIFLNRDAFCSHSQLHLIQETKYAAPCITQITHRMRIYQPTFLAGARINAERSWHIDKPSGVRRVSSFYQHCFGALVCMAFYSRKHSFTLNVLSFRTLVCFSCFQYDVGKQKHTDMCVM